MVGDCDAQVCSLLKSERGLPLLVPVHVQGILCDHVVALQIRINYASNRQAGRQLRYSRYPLSALCRLLEELFSAKLL